MSKKNEAAVHDFHLFTAGHRPLLCFVSLYRVVLSYVDQRLNVDGS